MPMPVNIAGLRASAEILLPGIAVPTLVALSARFVSDH
jgi:hypothetical protein